MQLFASFNSADGDQFVMTEMFILDAFISPLVTGADQLGGKIQVLQFVGNRLTFGYWYECIQ